MFVPDLVGKGPASLNPNNPKLYNAYMDFVPSELTAMKSGGGAAGFSAIKDLDNGGEMDSQVPEFIDSFPDPDYRPILYLRANIGASGITSGTGNAPAQYNKQDVIAYFSNHPRFEGKNDFPLYGEDPASMAPGANANAFLTDPSTTKSPTPSPRGKDGFVLIQAGRDRQFATSDDVFMP